MYSSVMEPILKIMEEKIMGFFSKLFKGPEIDMEKSAANANKMRLLFNQVVENGDDYRLIFGYTEDVSRFNYGFVHGSKTKIGNLIIGWNEAGQTIVVVPTVPDHFNPQGPHGPRPLLRKFSLPHFTFQSTRPSRASTTS